MTDTEGHDTPDPIAAEESVQRALRSDVIKRFYSRSDSEGLKQVAFQTGTILISGTLLWYFQDVTVLWTVSLVLHSFLLSFLFMGLHENVHETAFKSSNLSTIFRNIFGFVTFRPPIHYYYYHWAHHRHTGHKLKDPELFNSMADMEIRSVSRYLAYLSAIPFWVDRFATIFRHCFGIYYFGPTEIEYYFKTELSRQRCTNEARIYSLTYASLFLFGYWYQPIGSLLFYYWLLPSVLGQPHLRFYLLAEHQGCVSESSEIFDNTRNTTTFWIYKKLAWYNPYHATHHAWPGVPFHALHEVTALYKDKVKQSKCEPDGDNGYVQFNYEFVSSVAH
ncbi:uncharacterized protein LOC142341055 isoform X1 [Convolutriloba macropyga]|uniref:uncharacterized protein LOC142341055 isoform X1 n=1 Tax=Convolutriloba macropyga TaxID=536237 RepID=UPI003F51AFBD